MSLPSIIHESWEPILGDLFESPIMKRIQTELLPSAPFCPSNPKDIFKVFRQPLGDIRVVIVGQDPYPNPKYATGLAFGIPTECDEVPFSLNAIIDEVAVTTHDIALGIGEKHPFDGTLESWEEQGVFLYNPHLTCEVGKPNSHSIWWKGFSELVIERIANERTGLIWCLWGNVAKSFKHKINDKIHYVLEAAHPAAAAYTYGSANGFTSCGHFSRINEILTMQNGPDYTIDWSKY